MNAKIISKQKGVMLNNKSSMAGKKEIKQSVLGKISRGTRGTESVCEGF